MNDELEAYYELDASSGCDICQSVAGTYEDEPERPHENCDCEISLNFYEADDVVVKYENELQDDYADGSTIGSSNEKVNPNGFELEYDIEIDATEDPEVDLPSKIKDHFDTSEAEESLDISFSIPIVLEPHETVSVDIEVYYKTFFFAIDEVSYYAGDEIDRVTITGQTRTPVAYTVNVNRS